MIKRNPAPDCNCERGYYNDSENICTICSSEDDSESCVIFFFFV